MMTRRGIKRTTVNQLEDKQQNAGGKKSKTESPSTSKYFDKDDKPPIPEKTICIDTAESIVYKSESVTNMKEESDSDSSSSDEFMKAPFSLDDLGRFESLNKKIVKEENENKFTCSLHSSNLSGDSEDEEETNKHSYYDFSQIIQSQQLLIDTQMDQKEKKIEQNKVNFSKNSKKRAVKKSISQKSQKIDCAYPGNEELGVSELLYLTEGKNSKSNQNDYSLEVSSDNEDTNLEKTYSLPKEGVQVTIELPNLKQKRKSKDFDVEAAMKRRINLIRKENQIFMHKVHVLCWIAHCLNLNRTINNDDLLGIALSLIPSKHCYPPKHADLSYLEKLVDWFVTKVVVDNNHKHALNSSNLPLLDVLEAEVNIKVAFSTRDLVLIFVCMLRSLGIHARLIVSLQPVPLRPPISDLCQVNSEKKSGSCSKLDKPVNVTDKKNALTLPNKSKDKTLAINKNHSDEKVSSHYFENAIKPTIKANKQKCVKKLDVIKYKNSSLQSPYFTSSDELPLTKFICEGPHMEAKPKKSQTKSSTENKSAKQRIITKPSPKQSNSALEVEESLKTSKNSRSTTEKTVRRSSLKSNQEESLSSKKQTTNKCDSKSKIDQKQLKAAKNDRQLEKVCVKKDTKVDRPTRSTKQCLKLSLDSSESEVEFLEIKSKYESKAVSSSKSTKKKILNLKSKNTDNNEDADFEPSKPSTSKKKSLDRRVLSSDEDNNGSKKIGNDFWVEVFLEAEEKWISVDLKKKKVHCIQQLYNGATQPVRYVLACNNDGSLKDVTRRYAPQWLTVTRKQRADDKWWQETIKPYLPHRTQRERDEDEDLDRQMHDKPLPSSITEYKNHPLFALKRHLLKFEAIYPPDAPPFGFVRGEPVYSRGCVVELHAREAWIKEAKVVRLGEEPYKIVKARPKWDKLSQTVINDLPLPLFGYWQVEDYVPPPAVDGKVPRNQYGNVELYKPCMLPPGTVHLQVPMLGRVARKLDIDCAPAVVGWEFNGGSSHPVLDGFIVCEEFQDILLDAWNKEIDESAKRAKEKVEQRVFGNWKRLIKGLLIRERLKLRYDFGSAAPEKNKRKQHSKAGTSKS